MFDPLFNFLIEGGVPKDTIIVLLMFPIIASFIVAARQIVGIKAFGIYAPLIITFTFLEVNIKYGFAIFIMALLVASLTRFVLKKFSILYLPKMALILSITVMTMFFILIEAILNNRTILVNLPIYQILIIITLVEKFINVQIEKVYRTAIVLSVETLILSSLGYYIISNDWIRELVFNNPLIVILFFIIIILLGKYDGLRINEYIRFRKLISNR